METIIRNLLQAEKAKILLEGDGWCACWSFRNRSCCVHMEEKGQAVHCVCSKFLENILPTWERMSVLEGLGKVFVKSRAPVEGIEWLEAWAAEKGCPMEVKIHKWVVVFEGFGGSNECPPG